MEKLGQLLAQDRWDLVVVDTPPSRNALDFLDAPQRLGGAESVLFDSLQWAAEVKRALENGLEIRVADCVEPAGPDVNTPEDVERVLKQLQ